jgi:arginyl-tRNA synthetase
LNSALSAQAADQHHGIPQIGAGKNVMLDYGGPQIAKHMHVGHLRTAIVGDTLRRILKSAGYHAIGDIHMGDWGLQMGMVISELEHRFPSLPYFDLNFKGTYPSDPPVPFDDMGELYPTAAQACKSDPVRMDQARKATLDLQQKHPGYMALWKNVMRVSVDAMRENYTALNVHFDLWRGEYDADYLIPDMISECKRKTLCRFK